jgi:hypothetical protein
MTLLAAYSFDEAGDTVTDYSGIGNNFTLTGTNGIRTSSGKYNGGLTKNGSIMPELPIVGQTNNRTVMMWAQGGGDVWYIRWEVDAIDSGAWGIINLSGEIGVMARSSSSVVRPRVTTPVDGLWHHYAGTYDGTTVRFFVDGVEVASATLAGPIRVDVDRINIMEWTSGTIIDDLRIYDEALEQAAIASLMNIPVEEEIPPSGARYWNGTAWVQSATIRVWNGTEWVQITTPIS